MIAIFMRILNECMTNNFLKLSVSLYSSKLGPITDTMVMCVVCTVLHPLHVHVHVLKEEV